VRGEDSDPKMMCVGFALFLESRQEDSNNCRCVPKAFRWFPRQYGTVCDNIDSVGRGEGSDYSTMIYGDLRFILGIPAGRKLQLVVRAKSVPMVSETIRYCL